MITYIKSISSITLLACCQLTYAAETTAVKLEPWQQAQATEVWQPIPKKITARIGDVPSDAIALLDHDLSSWESTKGDDAKWQFKDGQLTVTAGEGEILTKQSFCDAQYHVEWQAPQVITDKKGKTLEGQSRGNSGFFIQERYEVQVLDSFSSKTYPNGQASSIYKQHIPLVNATLDRNEWNVYDIIFSSPHFSQDGNLEKPAYITVLHNGVLVQNHTEIQGATAWIGTPKYSQHGCAPLLLQDHGNPVKFRNIWVREL